jgi:hypothetical protein
MSLSISPALPLNLKSRECVIVIAGAAAFIAATSALAYLLISMPQQPGMMHIASASAMGVLDLAAFTTFVVGMVIYQRKQNEELEILLQELKEEKPIEIVDVELKPSEHTSLEYLEHVRQEIPPLFDGLKDFLIGFAKGYYQSENKSPAKLNGIHEAIESIKKEINVFLQNPEEVLRAAIGIAAFNLIDDVKMKEHLHRPEGAVVRGLPEILKTPDSGYETESLLIKQILQILVNNVSIADGELRKKVKELKEAHKTMLKAKIDEKLEKEAFYKGALIAVVDHLYTHASLKKDQIEKWTIHLIPSFLEQWRGSLFERLEGYMLALKEGFYPNGIFNDTGWKTKIRIGKMQPSWFIYPRIKDAIDIMPLVKERKDVMKKAAISLFPVLIEPFYHATFENKHKYRAKLESIILSDDFILPKPENTWKAYIEAFAKFFHQLAQRLYIDNSA